MPAAPRPDIETLLYRTDLWIPMADGTYESRYETASHAYRHLFSKEELCAHHPLLPIIIERLATKRHWLTDEFGASGIHVENSLYVAMNKSFVFNCYHSGANLFRGISEIKPYPDAERWITIKGTALTLVPQDIDGPCVPLVARGATEEKMFNMDYIDAMYPGWEARWHTAVSLGLAQEELVLYCFRPVEILNHALAGLSIPDLTV